MMAHHTWIVYSLIFAALMVTGDCCSCFESIEGVTKYSACGLAAACKKTWAQADDFCQYNYFGHLSRVPNITVQRTLATLLTNKSFEDTWVGGKGTKTGWMWITDSRPLQAQGCYQDDPSAPDLVSTMELDQATPDTCIQECRDNYYRFAGLQAGFTCSCGHDFGRHGMSTSCTTPCYADTERNCGGYYANYIYDVTGTDFNAWAYFEPQTGAGFDDRECMAVFASGSSDANVVWQWKADRCTRRKKFLCSIPYRSNGGCDAGLEDTGSMCLHVEVANQRTWFESRGLCHGMGGEMLEVRSEAIHNEVVAKLRLWHDTFWLGATKIQWEWITGLYTAEPMTYYNWANGAPSNEGDKCVSMSFRLSSSYQWSDIQCNQPQSFICESSSLTTTTSTTTTTTTTTTPTTTTSTTTSTTTPTTTTTPSTTSTTMTRSTTSAPIRPSTTMGTTRSTTTRSTTFRWDATDVVTPTPATSSTGSTTTTSYSGPTPEVTPTTEGTTTKGPGDMQGLTREHWVGIGVAVAIILLIFIAFIVIILRRKCDKSPQHKDKENGFVGKNPFVKDGGFSYAEPKTNGTHTDGGRLGGKALVLNNGSAFGTSEPPPIIKSLPTSNASPDQSLSNLTQSTASLPPVDDTLDNTPVSTPPSNSVTNSTSSLKRSSKGPAPQPKVDFMGPDKAGYIAQFDDVKFVHPRVDRDSSHFSSTLDVADSEYAASDTSGDSPASVTILTETPDTPPQHRKSEELGSFSQPAMGDNKNSTMVDNSVHEIEVVPSILDMSTRL